VAWLNFAQSASFQQFRGGAALTICRPLLTTFYVLEQKKLNAGALNLTQASRAGGLCWKAQPTAILAYTHTQDWLLLEAL